MKSLVVILFLAMMMNYTQAQEINYKIANKLDQRIHTTITTSSATIYGLTDYEGETVLTPLFTLRAGHKISFRPNVIFSGQKYLTTKGEPRSIRARYFGSLIIDEGSTRSSELREKIREANKVKIFTYEWNIDKTDYVKAVFSEPASARYYGVEGEEYLWDKANPTKAWTAKVSEEIEDKDRVFYDDISDIKDFCPNFENMEREEKNSFWIHFLNLLANKESKFDPLASAYEGNFGDGSLDVTSRGLLQMSYKSLLSRAYRRNGCDLDDASDLHDPEKNIECAVAIFSTWIKKDGCISCKNAAGKHRGVARYWSPLRESYQVSCSICSSGSATIGYRDHFEEKLKALPFCQ